MVVRATRNHQLSGGRAPWVGAACLARWTPSRTPNAGSGTKARLSAGLPDTAWFRKAPQTCPGRAAAPDGYQASPRGQDRGRHGRNANGIASCTSCVLR